MRLWVLRKCNQLPILLVIMGCISVLFACSKVSDAEILAVDINPKRTTPDSVIFKDREIVILETCPKSIIAGVVAMDMYKDNLYILDDRRANIFVFKRDGTFVSTIGRKGRGPGEYTSISSFCIDRENDELIISVGTPRKLVYYSLSGEFIAETEVDDYLYQILKCGDRLYGRLTADEKHDFVVYTFEEHKVKSVEYPAIAKLKSNKEEIMTPAGNMILASRYGTLFTRVFDNTLYEVSGNRLVPLVTLDFGKYQLPDANTLSGDELRQTILDNRIIYGISNARIIGEGTIIFDGYPNGIFIVDNGEARQYGRITDELSVFGHHNMTAFLDPDTEYVAFVHDASDFMILRAKDKAALTGDMARIANTEPEDNPVIYFYKLK